VIRSLLQQNLFGEAGANVVNWSLLLQEALGGAIAITIRQSLLLSETAWQCRRRGHLLVAPAVDKV
jgi:hypothetical protein